MTNAIRAEAREVPDPDPADGGLSARLLLLLERPGRAVTATGFVSRDNPTPTARNLRRFIQAAALPRKSTLIWNVVPWLEPGAVRDRPPDRSEIASGLAHLPTLLRLMPGLAVVVMAGRIARMAAETVRHASPEAATLFMPHPSPTILCTDPAIGRRIAACLDEAANLLRERP